MNVAIIGGIYGKSLEYRERVRITPETALEDGLRKRGINVSTFSNFVLTDSSHFDIIHVHHLCWGAIRAAIDTSNSAFVFSPHRMSESLPARFRLGMGFVMRRADAVVVLSSLEEAFQTRNYSLSGAVVPVIPNGIPTGTYRMNRRNPKGSGVPWQILYVGQLIKLKRVDVLLEAVSRLSFPFTVNLVYQNAELELELRSLASKLGIADAVRFVGSVKPEELCRLYNESDLFVLPSSSEALPTVITEAMLCGTPIVATDVGGVREQLGGFGTIVSPNSSEELTAAIMKTISQYHRFEGQAMQMSEHAGRNSSVVYMVDRHVNLYRQLSEHVPRRRSNGLLRPCNSIVRLGLEYPLRARSSSTVVA